MEPTVEVSIQKPTRTLVFKQVTTDETSPSSDPVDKGYWFQRGERRAWHALSKAIRYIEGYCRRHDIPFTVDTIDKIFKGTL